MNRKAELDMNKMRYQLSRRTMLRGLGASMALPWMESRRVWGDTRLAATKASEAPTRMAILFSGCGYHRDEWWAKGDGADMELGKVLTPLNEFRDKMVFIRGLYNAEALKGNARRVGQLFYVLPIFLCLERAFVYEILLEVRSDPR